MVGDPAKIILMDRDGTVIKEQPDGCIDCTEKICLFDDTISSLDYLHDNGFRVIFVTNQTGVGDGRMTEAAYISADAEVQKTLKQSRVTVLHTYVDMHGKTENHPMKKPEAGMLLAAAQDYRFQTSKTFMIGDRMSDVIAGQKAGCRTILINRPNTPFPNDLTEANVDFVVDNLNDAVRCVVDNY